jgi:acylphosphatase
MIRRRVRVSGRVQGVGFRYRCAEAASALGLAGWIRNQPDGSVEAVFEGAEAAVDSMTEWMRQGPRHARVTGVEVYDESPAGENAFRIGA